MRRPRGPLRGGVGRNCRSGLFFAVHFHPLISEMTGNPLLTEVMTMLWNKRYTVASHNEQDSKAGNPHSDSHGP